MRRRSLTQIRSPNGTESTLRRLGRWVRAEAAIALAWTLTAASGCLPVQTYPFHEIGVAPDTAGAVCASEREVFEDWMVDRAAELRKLLDAGSDEAGVGAIETELERAGVDWKTFLVKTTDAHKFPRMAVLNHSWFQWRQAADLERTVSLLADQPAEASDLLPDGEVPHSAFFTRTEIGSYTPERLCEELAEIAPAGNITVTREKKDGTSEGFFGVDERGIEYIFIFDPPLNPEMQTSAEHIGSTLVRVLGWRVPKTAVCTVTGTGSPQYDGRRATATVAVKGYQGGWTYRAYRNRRELRALQVVGAWLNNVDQSEHNTGTSKQADGVYAYYIWDYGASLGSFTFRPKWPRLGWQYFWDPLRYAVAEATGPPWPTNWQEQSPAVGYFTAEVDPDRWVPFYPNLAFDDVTPADKRWAAQRIAQISDEQIRTIVESAQYTHSSDAEYVIATVIARRDRVVARYVTD